MASCNDGNSFVSVFSNQIPEHYRKQLAFFGLVTIIIVASLIHHSANNEIGFQHLDVSTYSGVELSESVSSESTSIQNFDQNQEEMDSVYGYVHIAGAVKNPGVYEITSGMRILDVLMLAGPDDEADIHSLNLAAVVFDGQKIVVPVRKGTDVSNADEMDTSLTGIHSTDGKINVNYADLTMLMSLPGIGEVKGNAILEYRSRNGYFHNISDLKKVDGIGSALYEKIKDRIEV